MTRAKTKLRVKDTVVVMAGKEKGKKGRVLKIQPDDNSLIVEKVNFVKRHQRPTQKQRKGGIVEKEGPIYLSKVLFHCTKCDRGTKLGVVVREDGTKQRFCRRCKETV
jgi:large subunit ribosomal protein L24